MDAKNKSVFIEQQIKSNGKTNSTYPSSFPMYYGETTYHDDGSVCSQCAFKFLKSKKSLRVFYYPIDSECSIAFEDSIAHTEVIGDRGLKEITELDFKKLYVKILKILNNKFIKGVK